MITAEQLAEMRAVAEARHGSMSVLVLIDEIERLRAEVASVDQRPTVDLIVDLGATRRERDAALATIARVEAVFAGGPDTACRTTWREVDGNWSCGSEVECVEVPLAELRKALATEGGDA